MRRRRSATSSRSSRSSDRGRPARALRSRVRRPRRSWGRLRAANENDLPTLVAHRHAMFSDIGGRTPQELAGHDRVYARWARKRMRTGELRAFVVESSEGRAVGSGAIWLQSQQPRPGRLSGQTWPYIMSMYTEPPYRGRGVASRLVKVMVRWATDHGYPRVFLHASKMGRPLYARFGFQDGNEMRLDLPARRSPRRGR